MSQFGVLSFSGRKSLAVCVEAHSKYKYLSGNEAGYVDFSLVRNQTLSAESPEPADVVSRAQHFDGGSLRQSVEGENGENMEPLSNKGSTSNYVGEDGSGDSLVRMGEVATGL